MTYKLTFLASARKEWEKLNPELREQFKKKLRERLAHPCVLKDKLSGLDNCYKIKLRTAGSRLVYKVINDQITVQVIAIGKRDKNKVYNLAYQRDKD